MCLLLLTYQKPTKQNLIKARKFLSGFLNFLLSVVPLFHWPLTSFWQPALWAAKVNNFRRISTSVEAKFLLQQTGCLHFNVWSKAIVLSSIMSLASAGRSTSPQVWTLWRWATAFVVVKLKSDWPRRESVLTCGVAAGWLQRDFKGQGAGWPCGHTDAAILRDKKTWLLVT